MTWRPDHVRCTGQQKHGLGTATLAAMRYATDHNMTFC